MAVKKIPISLLKVGMYITKLDISWIDSPFMYHHLKIKNAAQIDKLLKAGVKQLSIDTSKGVDVEAPADVIRDKSSQETDKSQEDQVAKDKPVSEASAKEKVPERTSISQEFGVAKELKGKVEKLADEINEALKNDKAVDARQVSPLIDGTLSSLQRNNQALATLINIQRKDASLANHTFASFSLVLSISIKLSLGDDAQQALALAAFFHDTGWLKLPMHLLGKASPYTASEKKLIYQHVSIGLRSLKQNCELSSIVMRIITEHHEHLDGSGYPSGLKSDQIHPLSKVFAVVVRYDELVHGLLDRPAVTPHGALANLYKEAKNEKLDEPSVSALISLLSVYPVGSAVQLSNKEKGIVLEIDADQPKLPVVKVVYDMAGMAHIKPKVINLAKIKTDKELSITSVLDLTVPGADPAQLLRVDLS